MLRPELSAVLAALALACGPVAPAQSGPGSGAERPGDKATQTAEGGQWAACHAAFAPSGDARADLDRLTRSCGPTGGMHAITPVRLATQRERDPVDRYTFYVPKAGSCYRIYAVGSRGIEDLDLLLRGPDGEDVVADLTHDRHPIVPPHGPICFDAPGLYLLEVSVFRGSGSYAVQVWGS
jgi:hypothetical protein